MCQYNYFVNLFQIGLDQSTVGWSINYDKLGNTEVSRESALNIVDSLINQLQVRPNILYWYSSGYLICGLLCVSSIEAGL
jgi:hypothetical protein